MQPFSLRLWSGTGTLTVRPWAAGLKMLRLQPLNFCLRDFVTKNSISPVDRVYSCWYICFVSNIPVWAFDCIYSVTFVHANDYLSDFVREPLVIPQMRCNPHIGTVRIRESVNQQTGIFIINHRRVAEHITFSLSLYPNSVNNAKGVIYVILHCSDLMHWHRLNPTYFG